MPQTANPIPDTRCSEPAPMRLFIAINPPPPILAALAPLQDRLAQTKADIRWLSSSHYHITIKFIGEVPDSLLPQISARLTQAAAQVPIFPLTVEGLSRFPPRGNPRVIIARVLSPDQRLTKLHRLIDSALGGIGITMDTHPLKPHLTLGRVQSNHGLNRLLRLLPKHEFAPFGNFEATQVTLYQSSPTPTGSQYKILHTAALAPLPAPHPNESAAPAHPNKKI